MQREKTYRRRRGRWPLRSGKCRGCGRQWSLHRIALILMAALCSGSCGTARKIQTEERRETGTEQSCGRTELRDTEGSAIRGIRKEGVPQSKAEISIPVDSLLKLPGEAAYTQRSGQATASVKRDGDRIEVTATCDSLEREVEYYEELYLHALEKLEAYELERSETKETGESRREEDREPLGNPIVIFIMGLTGGALATIATTIYIKERRERR